MSTTTSPNDAVPTEPKALSSIPFIDAIKLRRSIYALNNTSPIDNAKIQALVRDTMNHCPSSFNSQSTRVLVVLGDEHGKFWDMTAEEHKKAIGGDEAKWERTKPRIDGLKAAYGTVVFYEDNATVAEYQKKFPPYHDIFPQWSEHTSGIHQFVLWTALEAEGLGANLQHYQTVASVSQRASEMYNIPKEWNMMAQLVFGGINEGGRPTEGKEKKPTSETVKVFGA